VALKSDAAAERSKDQLSRDFLGCSIFDFCNKIGPEADVSLSLTALAGDGLRMLQDTTGFFSGGQQAIDPISQIHAVNYYHEFDLVNRNEHLSEDGYAVRYSRRSVRAD
jgi:hypothetical protein